MDPVIAQIARARSIEPHFLNRMKAHLVHVVQPMLDERDVLAEQVKALRAENDALKAGATAVSLNVDGQKLAEAVTGAPARARRRRQGARA